VGNKVHSDLLWDGVARCCFGRTKSKTMSDPTSTNVFYVRVGGSDTNTGKEDQTTNGNGAFATIGRAVEAANPGDYVSIGSGEYAEGMISKPLPESRTFGLTDIAGMFLCFVATVLLVLVLIRLGSWWLRRGRKPGTDQTPPKESDESRMWLGRKM
jgi:hypothetical protein